MAKDKKADKAKAKQSSSKDAIKEAKAALTDYLKTNKLSRDKDYSKDKKHGKNIKTLELAIEKASDEMDTANTKVDKVKKKEKAASAGREQKYDYPEGLTAEEKKKFRIKARKDAEGGSKKEKTPKAGKADKEEKSSKKEKTKNLAPKEKETSVSKKDTSEKGKGKKKKVKSKAKND